MIEVWLLPLQDPFDLLLQPRKILVCGIPDLIEIDPEVLVNKKMSHGNDIFPGNLRVLVFKFCRDAVCSLTGYLDVVEYPDLMNSSFDEGSFSMIRWIASRISTSRS